MDTNMLSLQNAVENKFCLNEPEIRKLWEKKVILSERDLCALRFVLEMKFSTLDDLFQRFYRTNDNFGVERGREYLKKRLVQLVGAGYLTTTRAFSEKVRLFLATKKTYRTLKELNPEKEICFPLEAVDGRTVVHDYYLGKLRVYLEEVQKVTSWTSDRHLKCFPELINGLRGQYVPDAIYTNSENEKVALELELSLKAKSKYKDKIRKYIYLLKSQESYKAFSKVHFVYSDELVKKHLENATMLYPEFFKVESIYNYLK